MPELPKLVEIAKALEVSPGWLAFGDTTSSRPMDREKIVIDKVAFGYIFTKALCLHQLLPMLKLTYHKNQAQTSVVGSNQQI